ncbi:MAG: beta-ketoacyl synthase chain length factor [Kiritimatiellae bacterium]|nr:beta-ketoacyl synthase chain length factor [Kiritimatiellia bacterium]
MNRTVTLAAWSAIAPGDAPDVSFVPPLVRRRLSPLQRLFFALARGAGAEGGDAVTFATRDGEDTLTRRIVADFQADGAVSPHRFSTSVYNAAPGLWSVFAGNRTAYTAVAAGDDTLECALLEALGGGPGPAMLVYAEETGGGYGAAARFADAPGARRIEVFGARPGGGPIGFEAWADFLAARTQELAGRWLSLRYIA